MMIFVCQFLYAHIMKYIAQSMKFRTALVYRLAGVIWHHNFFRSSAASNLSLRLLSRTHGLVSLNIAEFQLFNFTYGTCAEPLDSGFSSDMRFYNPQDRRKSWKKFDHSWWFTVSQSPILYARDASMTVFYNLIHLRGVDYKMWHIYIILDLISRYLILINILQGYWWHSDIARILFKISPIPSISLNFFVQQMHWNRVCRHGNTIWW